MQESISLHVFFPRSCLPVACCFPHCLLILFWPFLFCNFSLSLSLLNRVQGGPPYCISPKKTVQASNFGINGLFGWEPKSIHTKFSWCLCDLVTIWIGAKLWHIPWFGKIFSTFWQSMGGNTAYQNLLMQSSHAFLYGNVGPSLTNQIWFAHALFIVWFGTLLLFSRKKWQLNRNI